MAGLLFGQCKETWESSKFLFLNYTSMGWYNSSALGMELRLSCNNPSISVAAVQDCSNSITNTLELLQSCTKPSISSNMPDHSIDTACTDWSHCDFSWCNESLVNTLRLRQNGRHFPDDIFKCIFLNEKVWILINISQKFVPKCSINNIPVLVQIMAWRRPGNKPLSVPMMVSFPTHICVTRPQWVNISDNNFQEHGNIIWFWKRFYWILFIFKVIQNKSYSEQNCCYQLYHFPTWFIQCLLVCWLNIYGITVAVGFH